MARVIAILAFLIALVQGGEAINGNFSSPSVICDATGFQPSFNYSTIGEDPNVSIDMIMGGSSSNDPNCVAQLNTTTGNLTILMGDFSINYTQSIPYATNRNATCGGTLQHWIDMDNGNKEMIRFEVSINAVVTQTYRSKIERKTQYPFKIICLLEKEVNGISTNNSFQVVEELVDAAGVAKAENNFTFEASIRFHSNSSYNLELTQPIVTPKNNEKLYLEVSQAANQDLFKFVVNKCYATRGTTIPPSDASVDKDVFFEDQCHVDETVTFAQSGKDFQFSILSFSFPNPADTIFFHCDLYVCLDSNTTASCMQKDQSECKAQTKRRRRSVEGVDYDYVKTITAAQPVLFEASQVHTPSCGESFVYDRELEICSQENLLEVQNVRLSQDIWRQEYANTSSSAFKELARTKEFQFWVLLVTTGQNRIIHGVKVMRARPGSIIMDVAIKYSDTVTAEQAFATFRQVLYTPSRETRVQKILQISHDKNLEYIVFVPRGSEKADSENLILIVVVVVLFVIIFITGVTLFKVKQARQTSTGRAAVGFDNKGIDNIAMG